MCSNDINRKVCGVMMLTEQGVQ